MSTGASPRPDAADVFDHLRAEDGEHVGYMEMTADGGFVPYDLLWQRRGEPMDLDEAEAVLDGIGLRLLAEDWLLQEEAGWTRVRIREIDRDRVIVGRTTENMSGHVAKAIDLVGGIDVELPTDRLRPAGAAR
ncbi:serine/threonine protein phosphatase [Brachybacterium kimchii]|uniref:Serine/threonine protein phosphatase n=1 Tax=Brachybacterium kimchii TaxID=2942909 RepID=A0ABY4N5G3_9MICO|nr:serine/threonine protein phosphatase [Brachybacterium kimchii]UQN28564.1 serine/threonine protein phosphatase [Brachybacterium kimchii]